MNLEAVQSHPGKFVGFMVAHRKAAITLMSDRLQDGEHFLILMLEKDCDGELILDCRTFEIVKPDQDFNELSVLYGQIVQIEEGGMEEGLIQIVSEHGLSFQLQCEIVVVRSAPRTSQPSESELTPAIGFASVEGTWKRWWKNLRRFSRNEQR
jgi:hypothetical protein